MSSQAFLQEFLPNNQTIPELSQIYHHIYFRDMNAQLVGANKALLNCLDVTEILSKKLPYSDFLTDPIQLNEVLNHDVAWR